MQRCPETILFSPFNHNKLLKYGQLKVVIGTEGCHQTCTTLKQQHMQLVGDAAQG